MTVFADRLISVMKKKSYLCKWRNKKGDFRAGWFSEREVFRSMTWGLSPAFPSEPWRVTASQPILKMQWGDHTETCTAQPATSLAFPILKSLCAPRIFPSGSAPQTKGVSKSPSTSLGEQIERQSEGLWDIFAQRLWVHQLIRPHVGSRRAQRLILLGRGLFRGLPDLLLPMTIKKLMMLAMVIIDNIDRALCTGQVLFEVLYMRFYLFEPLSTLHWR